MLLGCGCLLAMTAAFAPRVVLVLMWIFGWRVSAAFNNFLVPLLGLIFLPYTTIMYVLVWSPAAGVAGWDWVWVLLGVALDIMKWGQIANKRKQVPGYPSASEPAPQPAYQAPVAEVSEPAVPAADSELEKLADLRDKGVITAEEYQAKREQLGE
jgi:hypothetical protein